MLLQRERGDLHPLLREERVEQALHGELAVRLVGHREVPIEKVFSPIEINHCDCEVLDENTLQVSQGEGVSISDVVSSLSEQNVHVSHLRSSQNRLEALFLSLTS